MRRDEDKRKASSYAEGAISVFSILQNDSRTVHEIFLLPEAKKDEKNILRVLSLAKKKHVPISLSSNQFFESVTTGHTHGGIIARVGDRKTVSCEEVFDRGHGFVFLLCGVEDPFHFGCAVRSFYAAGAGGMILTPRNWLSAAGVTIRASAGATEAILCGIFDDPASLCALAKKKGYQIVCASEKDSVPLFTAPLEKPIFLIIGGEKRGITREFLQMSDLRIRIPYGRPFAGSLTTSAAAAVCAFEVLRREK